MTLPIPNDRKSCPPWCATYHPLEMCSTLDGDRRYATTECRDAGRCLNRPLHHTASEEAPP
jgi:hypothetical protein